MLDCVAFEKKNNNSQIDCQHLNETEAICETTWSFSGTKQRYWHVNPSNF